MKKIKFNKIFNRKRKLKAGEMFNFKLKEFAQQSEELVLEYLNILSYKKGNTKNKIFHLKVKEVDYIKKHIFSENDNVLIEIVAKVQDLSKKDVYNLGIIQFFSILNSIKEQIIELSKKEVNALTPNKKNIKWELVNGSKRVEKFGILNTLESLANKDLSKYEEIKNMKYSFVFGVLAMRKVYKDISDEMDAIKLPTTKK